LLALTTLLAGCNEKQANLPPPPAEVRVAQPILRNVTRYLEMQDRPPQPSGSISSPASRAP
jgi:hypothetical protein